MSTKLVAFDMDGTLLTSQKTISPRTSKALGDAFDAGIICILSTGRSYAEIKDYIPKIPGLRYAIIVSGACILDLNNNSMIYQKTLEPSLVETLFEYSEMEDVMVQMLTHGPGHAETGKLNSLARYGAGHFEGYFQRMMTAHDDLKQFYLDNPFPLEKFNFYHTDVEARERTRERLIHAGLPLVMKDSEITSLECTFSGVNKGVALLKLCEYLGIDIKDTAAVGDAPNDLEILEAAGVSVAMGNAAEEIKQAADLVVADCDHDGCGEFLEMIMKKQNFE